MSTTKKRLLITALLVIPVIGLRAQADEIGSGIIDPFAPPPPDDASTAEASSPGLWQQLLEWFELVDDDPA